MAPPPHLPEPGSAIEFTDSNTTEIWTGLDRRAGADTQCLQGRKCLAHDPIAALGQGDQALAQTGEVLLDREAVNRGPFSAATIPELEARPIAPKNSYPIISDVRPPGRVQEDVAAKLDTAFRSAISGFGKL